LSETQQTPADLIADDGEIRQLAKGFGFTEGPAWSEAGDFLVFSDIPGDALWRWDARSGVLPYRQPSNMANGGAFDREGRLIHCEHATSRVVREEPDGTIVTLVDRYQGVELNSPNDVVVASDGSIYFTDPTYGRENYFGVPRRQELTFQGLYRLSTAGELALLADDFAQPNGLCFSLDEQVLFVNDTVRMHIRAYEVGDDGSIHGGEVWAKVTGDGDGAADGMKLDAQGRLFCTGPGGIHVFGPKGDRLGLLSVPEPVGNMAWGGADRSTLFVCASTSLYALRTVVPGATPWGA
jgi:gluconolactonase